MEAEKMVGVDILVLNRPRRVATLEPAITT
jgi:hypothetical protein